MSWRWVVAPSTVTPDGLWVRYPDGDIPAPQAAAVPAPIPVQRNHIHEIRTAMTTFTHPGGYGDGPDPDVLRPNPDRATYPDYPLTNVWAAMQVDTSTRPLAAVKVQPAGTVCPWCPPPAFTSGPSGLHRLS